MAETAREQVLVHAPNARDDAIICRALERADVSAVICPSLEELCRHMGENTGAALVSDESLTPASVATLAETIHAQPPWSDLPLIVATSGGEATTASKRRLQLLEPLGNVALLERPLRTVTLVSAVQIALRSRRRQYQLRENFSERERLIRELERSNGELAEFAHIVSHDLQAPIHMVKSFSDLLVTRCREQLDDNGIKFVSAIQEGASRMDELVRTLLQYATVGQEPLTQAGVKLPAIVETVLTTLQPTIEELDAKIFYRELPAVYGDELQLQQLMQNLVGNALKYRQSGVAPRIDILAEKRGSECRVSVRDNGPGIAADYHELIFQPFKRLHGRNISGTGMGLALCRKIVERHGGKIWVESAPGAGSTFYFTLPTAEVTKGRSAGRLHTSPMSGPEREQSARA